MMESVSKSPTVRQTSQPYARNITSQDVTSTWYPLKCKIQLIHSKGALLLLWVTLMYMLYWNNLTAGIFFKHTQTDFSSTEENNYSLYLHMILQILAPLFGWIADAWIGRYKVILYSMLVNLLGCMIVSVEIIVTNYLPLNEISIVLFYISVFVNSMGFMAFLANTLPFITDQMIGASGTELSAVVDWYFWTENISFAISIIFSCYIDVSTNVIVSVFLYSTGIAVSLSSIFLFQHWIITEPQISNPMKHIISVLNFARKNKYPRNRSALTYWEENFPSRLDLGKEKYGGPFTEEGVENVKTFLMLIPLTFVISLDGLAVHVNNSQYIHMNRNKDSVEVQCFLSDEAIIVALITTFGIPFFHLILKPIFFRYLHRISLPMIKLLGFGFTLHLSGCLGLSVIELIGHRMSPNATCQFDEPASIISIDYNWALILIILKGIGSTVISLTVIKFIIAQSPHLMKGLLYGCFYAFTGVTKVLGFKIYHPFKLLFHTTPSCGLYYYLTQSIILIFTLILFIIVSKWYKLRMRNNPININLIVADHVEKDINQREESLESQSDSYESSDSIFSS